MKLRRLSGDDGVTLAELSMYSLLVSIVILTAGGLVISGTLAESTVRTVTGATTESQLAADSIQTGIRNSSAYSLTVPSTGTQLLRARVAQGVTAVTWTCGAWYYTPNLNDGSLWYKSSTAAIAAPTTSTITSWTLIADDLYPATGTTIFTIGADQLSFAFKTRTDGDPPASVDSSATSRTDLWETAPCF